MPVRWAVSHPERLVVISVTGVVGLDDMVECVAVVVHPTTQSYRKLVDFGQGRSALDRDDLRALAEHVQRHRDAGPMGALAVVVAADEEEEQARLFGALSVAERPWAVFREMRAARSWLEEQPSAPSRPLWLETEAAAFTAP
jgi:hypothetical protein